MEMNTYVNPAETQRKLNIFSNVKAATVAVETNNNKEQEVEQKTDLDLTKVVSSLFPFFDECFCSGDLEDEDLLSRQEEDRL